MTEPSRSIDAVGLHRLQAADAARALRGVRDGIDWRVRCPFAESHAKKRGCGGLSLRLTATAKGIAARCGFGCDTSEIDRWLSERGLVGNQAHVHEPDAEALVIWQSCRPIVDTIAESYLVSVGAKPKKIPPTLRYRPPGIERRPMVAAIVQAPDRSAIALHLLVLDKERPHLAEPPIPQRITIGTLGRGAVRLAPASPDVVVVDTIEEALLSTQSGLPAWASLAAWRQKRVLIPDEGGAK